MTVHVYDQIYRLVPFFAASDSGRPIVGHIGVPFTNSWAIRASDSFLRQNLRQLRVSGRLALHGTVLTNRKASRADNVRRLASSRLPDEGRGARAYEPKHRNLHV